jgi:hypothetical protein
MYNRKLGSEKTVGARIDGETYNRLLMIPDFCASTHIQNYFRELVKQIDITGSDKEIMAEEASLEALRDKIDELNQDYVVRMAKLSIMRTNFLKKKEADKLLNAKQAKMILKSGEVTW